MTSAGMTSAGQGRAKSEPYVVCRVCGVYGVWCVWCVVCSVWCVVYGVWCVVCSAQLYPYAIPFDAPSNTHPHSYISHPPSTTHTLCKITSNGNCDSKDWFRSTGRNATPSIGTSGNRPRSPNLTSLDAWVRRGGVEGVCVGGWRVCE